jgi:hypothetical protein
LPFFASGLASCAVAKVLQATKPPSAMAAIKLILLILFVLCVLLFCLATAALTAGGFRVCY